MTTPFVRLSEEQARSLLAFIQEQGDRFAAGLSDNDAGRGLVARSTLATVLGLLEAKLPSAEWETDPFRKLEK
jgi:hypothetical protein